MVTLFLHIFSHMLLLTLRDEVLFKLLEKLQVQQIISSKGLFTDHSLHGLYIFPYSVAGILKTQEQIYTAWLITSTSAVWILKLDYAHRLTDANMNT